MSKCKFCDTTEGLVYSGVDALLLGISGAETGTTCYKCANANRQTTEKETKVTEYIADIEKDLKAWFWNQLDHQRIIWDGTIAMLQNMRPDLDFSDLERINATLKEQTLQLEKNLEQI